MKSYLYKIGVVFSLLFCLMSAMGFCAERVKVGIAYEVGGSDDAFNAMVRQGVMQANADLAGALEVVVREPVVDSTKAGLLKELVAQHCDLVIGVGSGFEQSIAALAAAQPNVKFVLVDRRIGQSAAENLLCLTFRDQESAYIAGAAAALKSKSGKVGFVGGMEIPAVLRFQAGYVAGARSIKPDIRVFVDYIGDKAVAFKNAYRAKELALRQITAGADVMYHAAGFAGVGVIDAAVEKDVLAIGVDVDQSLDATEAQRSHILTSTIKRVDVSVCEIVKQAVHGTFSGGFVDIGLKGGGVDYAVNAYNVDRIADIKDRLDAIKADIISGKIHVPDPA